MRLIALSAPLLLIAVVGVRVRLVTDGDGRPLVAERLQVRTDDAEAEDAPFEFLSIHRVRGVSLSCAPPEVDATCLPAASGCRW